MVKDSHYNGVRDKPRPVLYFALFQNDWRRDVSFEIRHRPTAALMADVRREIEAADSNLPLFRIKTLRMQTQESQLKERLLATLSSVFGGLAMLLACLGLYGLMAYAVARRTSEIGVRLALGAQRSNVIAMVLRETLLLALAGIAAGIPLAIWMAGYVKTLLLRSESFRSAHDRHRSRDTRGSRGAGRVLAGAPRRRGSIRWWRLRYE